MSSNAILTRKKQKGFSRNSKLCWLGIKNKCFFVYFFNSHKIFLRYIGHLLAESSLLGSEMQRKSFLHSTCVYQALAISKALCSFEKNLKLHRG